VVDGGVERPRARSGARGPSLNLSIDFGDGGTARVTLPASQSYLVPSSFLGSLANAKGWCPGIATIQGFPFDIGDALLRSMITVFDRANHRIGFAPHGGCR
jgi:hypothetical protein